MSDSYGSLGNGEYDAPMMTDGMDLGIKGYNKVKVSKGPGAGIVVKGQAWVDADKGNYKQYPF